MKNGYVKTGKTDMYYISFGAGEKKLIVLPAFQMDWLQTVFPGRRVFRCTDYISRRAHSLRCGRYEEGGS